MVDATDNSDDYQFNAAAPIASSGLDVDKLLSGDEAVLAQAKSMGLPVPTATPTTRSTAGTNTPSPSGTSALQPQPVEKPAAIPNAIAPGGAPATVPSSLDGMGSALAQSQQPATNAPAPPSETTASPTVPATVTPSGTAEDPNQQGIERAGNMAESFSQKLAAQPTLAQELAPIQAKRTLPPQEFDPAHPEYRPTAGRRILRGLVGVGMGVAEHGIRGGLLGGLDPQAVGAAGYSAPTRQFSVAAQQQQAQQAALDKQQAVTTEAYKEDTGRAKDVITSINDIGKNYAAGETAESRVDVAQARKESADAQKQIADLRDEVQQWTETGKMPTTEVGLISAAELEKDPVKKAALQKGLDEYKALERARIRAAAGNPEAGTLRQSMIDNATEQIKALQDKYIYNPRTNQYVNPDQPSDVLSPNEYTDKKNEISAKLDQQLGQKKMKALGVRFNPADAGANKPSGRAARQQGNQATNKPKPPTPTGPPPQGAVDMALGPDNQYHYRDAGKKDLGVVK